MNEQYSSRITLGDVNAMQGLDFSNFLSEAQGLLSTIGPHDRQPMHAMNHFAADAVPEVVAEQINLQREIEKNMMEIKRLKKQLVTK